MIRKIYTLACMCLVLLSCEQPGLEDVTQKGYTVIKCDIESLLFDTSERVWPQGAMIAVSGSENGDNTPFYLRTADALLTKGEFYGQQVSGDLISAYYPYHLSYKGSDGAFPVSLTPWQSYTSDGPVSAFLNYCPRAFAYMSDGTLRFEYPFGMLCFKVELAEAVTVEKIVVSASVPLAGTGKVTPEGLIMDDGAPQTAELECAGALSRDQQGTVPFYLTVVPGTYKGLAVEFYIDGDDKPIYCSLTELEIPRVGAGDFSLVPNVVLGSGPEGFVGEKVEFDKEEE